jgi:hypothetical protein
LSKGDFYARGNTSKGILFQAISLKTLHPHILLLSSSQQTPSTILSMEEISSNCSELYVQEMFSLPVTGNFICSHLKF